MARPMARKPALPDAATLRACATAGQMLAIRVTPNAGADAIAVQDGAVLVRVTATPEAGKANAAVLVLLARALGVPRSALVIVRGETGRDKLVRLPPTH
ncbi:hypothetical protein CAP39_08940 [Sphingomonas sp. IBVSS1]|nr:hypothetical protein CAP39_08940 [Sphingomonas sp. IBVSS1]